MKNSFFFLNSYLKKSILNFIYFLNILVLRPGYGLTPSPKAQTLPTCRDMQRSSDLDSTDLGTTNSCCNYLFNSNF